jgi:hypothetical protein
MKKEPNYKSLLLKAVLFMMRLAAALVMFTVVSCSSPSGQNPQTLAAIEAKRIRLPNGWGITPVGRNLPLGDLPLNIAVSPSGKMLAVTNNGQSDQSIQLIDVDNQVVLDSLSVTLARPSMPLGAMITGF